MNEYDTALKNVLQRLTTGMLEHVTGYAVTRWHNVELPEVRSLRADLLGETADGQLVHIELQSTNDAGMAFRMAEYALAIYRCFGRMPAQVVLFVGFSPLNMNMAFAGPHLSFECRVTDIRHLDGERGLASERVEDRILAILLRLANEREAVLKILHGIAACDPAGRRIALTELLVLAGLRKSSDIIRREAEQMPILNDIMDHEVLGPVLRQGMEIGRAEGRVEGRRQGQTEGERMLLLRQFSRRFGTLPPWAERRLTEMTDSDLERIALLFAESTGSLEDLLR